MTLICDLDLDILETYLCTTHEVAIDFQKLEHKQDRHTDTDRRDRMHYHAAFVNRKYVIFAISGTIHFRGHSAGKRFWRVHSNRLESCATYMRYM